MAILWLIRGPVPADEGVGTTLDTAGWAIVAGIITSILTYVISPWIKAKLETQRENDPAQGWRKAVLNLENRVTALEQENTVLEGKVQILEGQVNDKTATIARLTGVIAEQSNMLTARDTRIIQLTRAFRTATDGEPPAPDPASAYWLNYTPQGAS